MTTVIGVKFRCSGKMYYFDPENEQFDRGDKRCDVKPRRNPIRVVFEIRKPSAGVNTQPSDFTSPKHDSQHSCRHGNSCWVLDFCEA